jgi:hypothetical protein
VSGVPEQSWSPHMRSGDGCGPASREHACARRARCSVARSRLPRPATDCARSCSSAVRAVTGRTATGLPRARTSSAHSPSLSATTARSRRLACRPRSSLAQVQLRTGELEDAERLARRALVFIGSRVDHRTELGNAQLVLGHALLAQGKLDEADETFRLAEQNARALRRRRARRGLARPGRGRDLPRRPRRRRRALPPRRRSPPGLPLLAGRKEVIALKTFIRPTAVLTVLFAASLAGKLRWLGFFGG